MLSYTQGITQASARTHSGVNRSPTKTTTRSGIGQAARQGPMARPTKSPARPNSFNK